MSTISVSKKSRYKDTNIYAEGVDNAAYAMWEPIREFKTPNPNWPVYSVVAADIGFLDRIAFEQYGDGYETLWWVIAVVNGIIDPERDMYVGMQIRIPPVSVVTTFSARGSLNG